MPLFFGQRFEIPDLILQPVHGDTAHQLRKEVALGMWFIFQADTETVFDSDPDTLWQRMIRKTERKLAFVK